MKKLLIAIAFLTSISCFATTDIRINISTDSNLTGIATGTYLASKDSFFCKEFSMNDGSLTRVFKRRYVTFEAKNGVVIIPESLDSKCKFKRVGGASLAFEVKGTTEPYNVVSVNLGGGDSQEEQVVKCEEVISGPSNDKKQMISCYGDLQTSKNGEVKVLILKD